MNDVIMYRTADGLSEVALYTDDGDVWLSQQQMAELFATSVPNISMHVSNILKEDELDCNSVVKNYLTTATDGKNYEVSFYSLSMILAVGFRVRSVRGLQFRQWANRHLTAFLVKGFVIDHERLKNVDGRVDYFDELLEQIRDVRASEKRFYQKVRDLFSLSCDYDPSDKATQMFFAEAQNKLLYAATGYTAAELISKRANLQSPNMGLVSWKGSIVRKQDITIAKNYLNIDELDTLNRLVVIFLETAELRAKNREIIMMDFWKENMDRIIVANDFKLLVGKGTCNHNQMELKVRAIYADFDKRRRMEEAKQEDQHELEELESLANKLKKR